jgi:hypothetical protein
MRVYNEYAKICVFYFGIALLVYLGETVVSCGVYQTFWEAPIRGSRKEVCTG